MSSLLIGSSSQLSYFFPKEYDRISSREIDYSKIIEKKYDNIFILFAEQRTFLNSDENFFIETNVIKTLDLIEKIQDHVKKIVVYSTSELWNNYAGKVFIEQKFDYNYTPYIKSKEILCDHINKNRKKFEKVVIVYPFNFNSPYRKSGFLFSKIFESLVEKKVNEIGDINFFRDIVHPSIIVKESINTDKDILVGSGHLINVENFVKDLFELHNMNYKDYLLIDKKNSLKNLRKNYYSGIEYSNYKELLELTSKDIYEYKIS